MQHRNGLFYGWVVVAAAFAVTFVGFGAAYSFAAFMDPLRAEFGASRGAVSTIFAATGFLYFLAGIVTGPLADRFGVRPLAILGMLLVAGGLIGAGLASTQTGVFASYVIGVGLGIGCAYVPAVAAVQRWFARRRGFASGLAVSGIGVGTLAVPPLAAALIAAWDWRTAYLAIGGAAGFVGIVAAALLRDDPAALGLHPDGDVVTATPVAARGVTLRDAVRSRRFAVLYLGSLLTGFGVFVPFAHLSAYAIDQGVPAFRAVLLVALIGAGSTAGRFLLGGIADRWGRRTSLVGLTLGMATGLAVWPTLSGFLPLAIFALLFGTFYGGWVALLPSLAMDWFGGRHLAGIIGVLYTSVAFGTLLGPSATGFVFDLTGSYVPAILAAALAGLAGAGLVAGIKAEAPSRPASSR